MKRIVLSIVGLASVATGTIGIFVPGLPTTVFLLAASYCFARSSPVLHRRLLENRVFGRYIEVYEKERAMPLRAKIVSLCLMWLAIVVSARWIPGGVMPFVMVGLGIVGSAVILFYVRTSRSSTGAGPHRRLDTPRAEPSFRAPHPR